MAELNPNIAGDTPTGSLRITTQRLDYDGQWVQQVKVRQSTAVVGAITPQESVSGGVWTAYHDEPISDILVYQVTETRSVPGLYVPRTRDDLLLGPITGTRRLVENSGLTTLKTATYSRTYEAHPNSKVVCWELIETNSDGTGSAGNPAYPITVENQYDNTIGDVETTTQASTDLTTDSSFVIGVTPDRAIITEWEPINQFLRKKIIKRFLVPGLELEAEPEIDDDGAVVTAIRQLTSAAAITEGEAVAGGVWTKITSEPYSGGHIGSLRWKVTKSRILATGTCPILREDRWNDQFSVVQATFRQYVPEGTTKQVIGAAYSTADTYVSNSITALTVSDPGSGYTTIPTLTVSASPGGGTLATATVTNLQVVSAAISAAGSGYVFGDTVTVAGGTGTAAILTVGGGALATLAINTSSRGTGYVVGDAVRLGGGVASSTGTVTVSTLALVSAAINAAGTGYVPGNTLTLVGGTFSTASTLTVSTTKVVSVSIVYAGTGGAWTGTPSAYPIAATTGTGTKVIFQASNNAGGQLNTISVTGFGTNGGGSYTANPADIANEPLATNPLNFPTDPPIVSVVMGVATFVIASGGSYTVGATTFTHTGGSGTGATFQSGVFGINTFTITSGGSYSAPAVTTFTAASSSGTGTGATFQTATYTINQLTVTTAGAYTVIPGSPNAVTTTTGTGAGMTVNLDFGVGTVALGTAGTLYYYPPTITPSYGTAVITPTMSAPILQAGTLTGYVVDTGLLNTEHSKIKQLVWSTMTTPPSRIERATRQFPLPNVFTWIGNWNLTAPTGFATGPFPGVHFNNVDYGVSVSPARCLISYSLGPSGSIPTTWQVITPGVSSKQFKVGPNTIHNAWIVLEWNPSYIQVTEIMPASTPASYVYGQSLIVEVTERKVIGAFYEKRVYTIN